MARKALLSLEIGSDLPDDGDELGDAKTNPEAEPMDLEDSIDALLREVDDTCASFEPESKPPIAANAAISDKGSKEAPVAPTPEDAAQSDEPEASDASDVASEDTDTNGDEALSALDAVENGTQALIEDAIDALLDEQGESQGDDSQASVETTETAAPIPAQATAEPDPTPRVVDEVATSDEDALTDEAIDAALDELDASVSEPASSPSPEHSPSTAELPDADALLESIADELTAEPDAEPKADADAEPQTDVSEPSPVESAPQPTRPEVDPAQNAEAQPEDEQEPVVADQVDADIASTLADLDESLAGVADDLLMGDFETPDGERIDSSALGEANDASVLLEQLGVDDLDLSLDAQPASTQSTKSQTVAQANTQTDSPKAPATKNTDEVVKPAAAAPKPAAKVAQAASPECDPLDAVIIAEQRIESIWETAHRILLSFATQALQQTKQHAWPLAARGLLLINKPLNSKPAQIRDTMGYLALWTALLCVVLWSYLFFIRETPTPEVREAPSRMLQPGESIDAIESTP